MNVCRCESFYEGQTNGNHYVFCWPFQPPIVLLFQRQSSTRVDRFLQTVCAASAPIGSFRFSDLVRPPKLCSRTRKRRMSDGWKTKRLENLEVNPAVPKTSMSLVSVELNFGSQQKQAGFLRLAAALTNRSWTLAGLVLLVDFRLYEQSIKDLCSFIWLCTQIAWFLEPLILDLLKQPIPKQDHGLLVECAAGGDQRNHR